MAIVNLALIDKCVQCAKKLGIDFAVISGCMNSTYGNEYEHDMAVWTESLQPKVTFVPWITLNSVTSDLCRFMALLLSLL